MTFDDDLDEWMKCLCVCEADWRCEWHERLRRKEVTRKQLAREMENIVKTSHAIAMGVLDPPPGWELICGRNHQYWAPADRGQ